jgi:UDP-glucuronate 4-epimerase
MKCLVTGAAGFIGYFTALRLLERGDEVVGIDNLNDYYSVDLKQARLDRLSPHSGFTFERCDCSDSAAISRLFLKHRFGAVVHLAAQAGVRYSIENPMAYAQSNLLGFTNVLEGCRRAEVGHLVYASTSSVYGGNSKLPFSESDPVDHPVSFYAATKKANELMAHSYSHLFRLPTTGLRFFTVYGPWGRPDMSPMLFARAIMEGTPIQVFNGGDMARDFTYIDDIVEGVVRIVDVPAAVNPSFDPGQPDPASSNAPYRIYNIGESCSVNLMEYIDTLERVLGRSTAKIYLPMQAGDVKATYAATDRIQSSIGFSPRTSLEDGLRVFAQWFKDYYRYT